MANINDLWKKILDGVDSLGVALQGFTHPAQWFVQVDGAVGTNDNDVIYTSGDVSMYNYHAIENMSAGAGVADVFVTLDGTNYQGPMAVEILDQTTETTSSLTIAQNKVGVLRQVKVKGIRVDQNGAVATDARIVHGVV